MPPSKQKKKAIDAAPYGLVFAQNPLNNPLENGRQHVEDALRVVERRLTTAEDMLSLPLQKRSIQKLMTDSFSFLQRYCAGPFEKDNLSHVGRLISNMKRHSKALNQFLGIDYLHTQLLAALHDLGKARVTDEMYAYLATIFGEDDFINLRVLPHEFYSMYWIQQLTDRQGISLEISQLLMDQIANHNFGPDLTDPRNSTLMAQLPDGQRRHWWVDHWQNWAKRAGEKGLKVNPTYGHTISPLANTLVLFDRVDGGHPHSWEKFLNQDLLSGKLEFYPAKICHILEESNVTAREQLIAVGRQLRTKFQRGKRDVAIEEFPPYSEALDMLRRNEQVIDRLKRSNEEFRRRELPLTQRNSILYEDRKHRWFRVDEIRRPRISGTRFILEDGAWKEIEAHESPVEMLLGTIYSDWD